MVCPIPYGDHKKSWHTSSMPLLTISYITAQAVTQGLCNASRYLKIFYKSILG